MKKLGLCIVYKNWNYGSILQSFATLIELRKIGIDFEIIRYDRKKNFRFYITSLPRLFNRDLLYSKGRVFRRELGKKRNPNFASNDKIRSDCFSKFVDEHFENFSPVVRNYDELCQYANKFDTVLVGSDQLWLPSGLATNFYNLCFVPDSINKIAYAASFGVSKIPFYQKKRTIEYLNRIDYISVREHSGQKIIKDFTGRDVPVIVDPTLVIPKEIWDKEIPFERKINEDYIFCYFLGDNLKHREEAVKLSKATGLKIVTLRHMDEFIQSDESFGDYAPYDVGPAEFVNLIRNATYVCTDSFHGSVFSVINHKQFISFNRYGESSKNSRNSRLDSLFSQLGIQRRYEKNIVDEMMKPIDYDAVDQRLSHLREIAENYLINAIQKG